LTLFPQGIGINKDGSAPDSSAILHIKADSAGVLIPRTDTSSIIDPAQGLIIFDTTDMCFFYFKYDKWVKLVERSSMRYYFADRDGDGFGDKFYAMFSPDQLPGYVPDSTDCDDDNPDFFPTNPELCDQIDNDCNPLSPDGSGEALYGTPCDGPDADLCEEGIWDCVEGFLICTDDTGDNIEVCDGVDNDCDPTTLDGSEESLIGTPCDGPDSDLCEEGVWECSGGTMVCTDNTGDNIEICDGVDNDCDPTTLDGSDEPLIGTPCDGPDSDLCEEGVWVCSGGTMVCTDNTSDDLDLCDGVDNDCDPTTLDGSDEPLIGTPCDGPDSDLCEEGVWQCSGGTMVCTDNTSDNTEICDGEDNNCDGTIDECPPFEECDGGDCMPCCSNFGGASCETQAYLGNLCGDAASLITQTGCGEAWFKFTLQECSTSLIDLNVTIILNVPFEMDYDLYVYSDCSTFLDSSTNSGNTTDFLNFTIEENMFTDQTTDFFVNVVLHSGSNCSNWLLQINGG